MRSESELQVFYEEAKRIMSGLGYDQDRLDGTVKLNGRLSRALGRCFYSRKLIEIQKEFFYHADASSLMNTILHELAHQVNTYNDKHGHHWQKIATHISQNTPYKITRLADMDKLEYQKHSSKYAQFKCLGCNIDFGVKLTAKKTIENVEAHYHCGKCKGKLKYVG